MKIRPYVVAGLFVAVAAWGVMPEQSAAATNVPSVVPAVAEAARAMTMDSQQPAAEAVNESRTPGTEANAGGECCPWWWQCWFNERCDDQSYQCC